MFWLSDKARCGLCRAGFIALCAAPTLAVLVVALWLRLPWHQERVRRDLEAQLGMRTQIGSVRYPRPGVLLCQDVRLADAETGRLVVRLPLVEAGRDGAAILVVASAPRIEAGGLEPLLEAVRRQLRTGGAGEQSLRLAARTATVETPEGAVGIADVRCDVSATAQLAQATLRFRVGQSPDDAVVVRLGRDRRANPFGESIEIHTGEAEVPYRWLAAAWPDLDRPGASVRFRGSAWASRQEGRTHVQLSGRFRGLDCQTLAKDVAGERISGDAELTLEPAQIENGRLVSAAGQLVAASGGTVAASLVEDCSRFLHCEPGIDLDPSASVLNYTHLAVGFWIDGSGITLQGRCAGGPRGAMLLDDDRLLLSEPADERQPLANLVRALAGEDQATLPATAAGERLSRLLPLPLADDGQLLEARRRGRTD